MHTYIMLDFSCLLWYNKAVSEHFFQIISEKGLTKMKKNDIIQAGRQARRQASSASNIVKLFNINII